MPCQKQERKVFNMEYVFTMVSGETHIIETKDDIRNLVKSKWIKLNSGECINMDNVEFIRKKEDWE